MEKNLSPEERLLRLIRNKNKGATEAGASVAQPSHPGRLKQSQFSYHNPLSLIKILFEQFFSIRKLNLILTLLVIIGFGYVIFEFVFFKEGKVEPLKKSEQNYSQKPEIKESPLPAPTTFDYYAERLNKRDIFKPAPGQDQAGQGTTGKSNLEELASNLRLAGIILDKQPQAIIEDTKLKKTYFLNKGDYIGEIKVEDILEGKVILSYGQDKLELVP